MKQFGPSDTRWPLEQTRDTGKHGLLFTENMACGLRRNMLGVRWIGLVFARLSVNWLVLDGAAHLPAMPADLMGQLLGQISDRPCHGPDRPCSSGSTL